MGTLPSRPSLGDGYLTLGQGLVWGPWGSQDLGSMSEGYIRCPSLPGRSTFSCFPFPGGEPESSNGVLQLSEVWN